MKFSIITPLFNKADYFAETAASVLDQTWADWEWIVVDDGSTDSSFDVAQKTAGHDPRVVFLRQSNSGPCTARNAGVAVARGEWLLFLDADDLLERDCLERFAAACQGQADIHVAGWRESVAGGGGVRWGIGHAAPNANVLLLNTAIAQTPWIITAAVVRRELIQGPCLWEVGMDRLLSEDAVFWWRLIARYTVEHHSFCAARYRLGIASSRDRSNEIHRWGAELFHALENNVNHWESLGRSLNRAQILSLVRVYSAFAVKAEGFGHLASEAFARADRLLQKAGWLAPAVLARRLLGCRHFERLRRCVAGSRHFS